MQVPQIWYKKSKKFDIKFFFSPNSWIFIAGLTHIQDSYICMDQCFSNELC